MKKIFYRGQSLFEVMVAIGLAAMILVAIVSVSTSSLSNSTATKDNAVANKYAQEGVEWARQRRDNSWNNITSPLLNGCLGKNTTSNLPEYGNCSRLDNIYDRSIVVTFNDPPTNNEAKVVVAVNWTEGSKNNSVVATTILSNWKP